MPALNVLALGDSIVWGQGNTDDAKFVGVVCQWLRTRGHDARLTSLAHSGAVVSPTANDAAPPIWGEVPDGAPSIMAELAHAAQAADPNSIDVLLLNGGINDVSPYHIVVANPFDPNGLALRTTLTTTIFSGPVRQLVDSAVSTFPRATIVVIGYYPIISADTALRPLARLMKHLARPAGLPNVIDLTIEHLPDELLALAIEPERQRMIAQSTMFGSVSTQLMRAAVSAHEAQHRVFFADPGFGPANAFAAPQTWLWNGADDPLCATRVQRYAEHIVTQPFDWPVITPLASMCHPNVAGSIAYAKAIEGCLVEAGL